jgi:hypothetical protein
MMMKKNTTNLQLCFGGYSCAGIKDENQDAFAALIPDTGELVSKSPLTIKLAFAKLLTAKINPAKAEFKNLKFI